MSGVFLFYDDQMPQFYKQCPLSPRTDNAVKNRFTTLCKKRAKHEALAKENGTATYINLNNKRVIFSNGLNTGGSESAAPLKKMRYIESRFPLS